LPCPAGGGGGGAGRVVVERRLAAAVAGRGPVGRPPLKGGDGMDELHALAWPVARLGELIEAVAQHRGLPLSGRDTPHPPEGLAQADTEGLAAWIAATAAWLGLEAEAVEASCAEVERLVHAAGPAILRLPAKGEARFVALLGGRRRTVAGLGARLAGHPPRAEGPPPPPWPAPPTPPPAPAR